MSEENKTATEPKVKTDGSTAKMPPKEAQAPLGLGDLQVGGARAELSLLPQCKNFEEVFQLCNWIAQSNIVPDAYKNRPADVFVAASYGAEIGLPFMTAVQKIAVIGGRPALPSDIKLAMVRSKGLLEEWDETPEEEIKTSGRAWCRMKRKGVPRPIEHSFTIDDAKRAGLWERRGANNYPTPWVLHPFRMLALKPRDKVLRDLFGDVFFGMLSVEEAQEIQLIETTALPESQLAEKSQPETKGKAILEAPAPPLKTEQGAGPTGFNPRPVKELFKEEEEARNLLEAQGKEEAPASEPEPQDTVIAQLVDRAVEQLRKLPGGGAKLMKLWQAYKLPTSQFGKAAASALLGEPELALFGNEVQKALAEIEAAKK